MLFSGSGRFGLRVQGFGFGLFPLQALLREAQLCASWELLRGIRGLCK